MERGNGPTISAEADAHVTYWLEQARAALLTKCIVWENEAQAHEQAGRKAEAEVQRRLARELRELAKDVR